MEDYVCLRVLSWWLRLSPCSYFWISAEPTAVCAECRCSTRLITPERITPLLRELHWLRVSERIQFRLYLLEYHWMHVTAPVYLAESSHTHRSSPVAVCARPTSRRRRCNNHVVQPWATGGCGSSMEQFAASDDNRHIIVITNIPPGLICFVCLSRPNPAAVDWIKIRWLCLDDCIMSDVRQIVFLNFSTTQLYVRVLLWSPLFMDARSA